MTNTIQKKYKVSSTQLLYQSCPYQAATLLISGPYLDKVLTNLNVFAFKYTTEVTVRFKMTYVLTFELKLFLLMYFQLLFPPLQFVIVLSCLISISVNFSTFLVIGRTSPVTYQVLGHLKTCLVLAFGYIIVQDPFSWRNILGILVAMVGMIMYSYYCVLENQQKAAETAALASQVCFHWLTWVILLTFFVFTIYYKNMRASLGATVRLLSCGFAVIGSSHDISLLQKCKVRPPTLEPQSGSDPSLDLAYCGSFIAPNFSF